MGKAYDEVISYMSVPPSAYKDWANAMVKYWGGGKKVHIGFEKPFGGGRNSLQDATDLHADIIASGLAETNFHLTDHWLSFFMNQHMSDFRQIVAPRLGIEWSTRDIERIVVTEYEERGFGGRGAFIDGLGQVRDMIQSHLLQVLALTVIDADADRDEAKLEFLNSLTLDNCELLQFEGLLRSKKMKFHADFADSTFCRVAVKSSMDQWKNTELVMQTGKSMDMNLYLVEFHQQNGPGIIKINIGKEEAPAIADISVENWKLIDASEFEAPLPGFIQKDSMSAKPTVDQDGNGVIVDY